jgi:voltage-gated potassium channel
MGKILTMGLIVTSLTVGAYLVTNLTSYFVGGQVVEELKGRRMEKQIASLEDHIIVAGFGKLGREVATELEQAGADFCLIESNHEHAEHARERGYLIIEGDASEDEVLRTAGVERAYGLVAALTGDPANVMVTITARELNPDLYIVARGIDNASVAKLRRAGANRIEQPFKISGKRLTTLVTKPGFVDFVDLFSETFSDDLHMEQFVVQEDNAHVGKTLRDLDVRRNTGGIIMAVERDGGGMIVTPGAEVELHVGDKMLVLGSEEQLGRFRSRYDFD